MTFLRMGQHRTKKPPYPSVVAGASTEHVPHIGTVKWFNEPKGFGFITPTDGSDDVFVHISSIQRSGLHSLQAGEIVEYFLVLGNDGKQRADSIKVR